MLTDQELNQLTVNQMNNAVPPQRTSVPEKDAKQSEGELLVAQLKLGGFNPLSVAAVAQEQFAKRVPEHVDIIKNQIATRASVYGSLLIFIETGTTKDPYHKAIVAALRSDGYTLEEEPNGFTVDLRSAADKANAQV